MLGAKYIFLKRHGNGHGQEADKPLPLRPVRKLSVTDFLKKVLDADSKSQTQCDSSMSLYHKSREMTVDSGKKIHGGDNLHEKKHRRSSTHTKHPEYFDNILKKTSQSESSLKLVNPCGLENLGNTCYLNAILQCLRSTECVRNYCNAFENVTRKQSKVCSALFSAFSVLITKMQSVTNSSINASTLLKFRNEFIKCVPWYSGNLQQDALEFFTYLLDALHEELKERTHSLNTLNPAATTTDTLSSSAVYLDKSRHHRRRRIGGLKYSDSSGQLTSTEKTELEVWDSSDLSKPPPRKWSYRPTKTRAVSNYRVDICQPAMCSATTTATERSFFKETFVGHLQTRLQCLRCGNTTTRDELFWNLALCVPEISSRLSSSSSTEKENTKTETQEQTSSTCSNSSSSSATSSSTTTVDTFVTLDDCLRAFTKPEFLDGLNKPFCSECKAAAKAKLQVRISQLPKILVLQFQRFESTCCKTKKRHLIKFDFEHDMAPYLVTDSTSKNQEAASTKKMPVPSKSISSPLIRQHSDSVADDSATAKLSLSASASSADFGSAMGSTVYRLYAVVYHQGGTERGHYTARCRLPAPGSSTASINWFLFDDENVTRITNPNDVIQPTAYILFYEQIEKAQDNASICMTLQDEAASSSDATPVKFTLEGD